MGGVVAEVTAGDAAFGGHDLVADPIQEGAVVTDHDKGRALFHQVALQPLDRLHIQVVGRLIQQQQVRVLQQDFSQGDAHLPAAGVVPDQVLCPLRRETDRRQQLVDAGIQLIAVKRFKPALELAEFLDELIQMIRILGCFVGGHRLLHLPLAVQHRGGFPEGLKQLLANAAFGIDVEFLLQKGNPRIALAHHLSAAGLLLSSDQSQLGGFAGTVHAHQADAITGFHFPGDVAQHLPGRIDLADVFESQHRPGALSSPSSLPADWRADRQGVRPCWSWSSWLQSWWPPVWPSWVISCSSAGPVAAATSAEGRRQVRSPASGWWRKSRSQPAARLDDPATAGVVVQAGQMLSDLVRGDRKSLVFTELADGGHRPIGILQGLSEQGLGLFRVAADALIESGCMTSHGLRCGCWNAIQSVDDRQAAWSNPSSLRPRAEASSMLRASMQSTLRSWA